MRRVDDELDAVIVDLGKAMQRAHNEGDSAGAAEFCRRMYAAIASRTPEHKARLEAAVQARIADELTFHGEWTRDVMAMERRA